MEERVASDRRTDRSRRRLSRDAVIEAALDVVDAEGLDNLSVRRLARELGVTPMAMYNHVADKDDLLAGLAVRVMADVEPLHRDTPWDARLRACVHEIRRAYLRHPAVVPVVQSTRSTAAPLLRPMEAALQALADAGCAPDRARSAWVALLGLTNGHVAHQLAGHQRARAADVAGTPGSAHFPRIAEALEGGRFDFDRAFAEAVDTFIAGLRATGVVDPA